MLCFELVLQNWLVLGGWCQLGGLPLQVHGCGVGVRGEESCPGEAIRLLAGPEVRLSCGKVRGYRLGLLPEGNRKPEKACEQGRYKVRAGVSTCVCGLTFCLRISGARGWYWPSCLKILE